MTAQKVFAASHALSKLDSIDKNIKNTLVGCALSERLCQQEQKHQEQLPDEHVDIYLF